RMEQVYRVQGSTKALQLVPASRGEEFVNRGSDSFPDSRQRPQPFQPFVLHEVPQIALQFCDGRGCIPISAHSKWIGALLFEQIRRLSKSVGNPLVRRKVNRHGRGFLMNATFNADASTNPLEREHLTCHSDAVRWFPCHPTKVGVRKAPSLLVDVVRMAST